MSAPSDTGLALRRYMSRPPPAAHVLRVTVREGAVDAASVLLELPRKDVSVATARTVTDALDEWCASTAREARAQVEWLDKDRKVVATRPLVRTPVESGEEAPAVYDGTPLDMVRQAQAHQERMARLYGSMMTGAMQQVASLARHATEMHARAMESVRRSEEESDALRVELAGLRELVAQAQAQGGQDEAQGTQVMQLAAQLGPLLLRGGRGGGGGQTPPAGGSNG